MSAAPFTPGSSGCLSFFWQGISALHTQSPGRKGSECRWKWRLAFLIWCWTHHSINSCPSNAQRPDMVNCCPQRESKRLACLNASKSLCGCLMQNAQQWSMLQQFGRGICWGLLVSRLQCTGHACNMTILCMHPAEVAQASQAERL